MIDSENTVSRPPENRRRRWQFGLPALLGTMMLLCLPFALWGAVLRAKQADQFWLILLCVAAPLGVLFLAGMAVSLGEKLRKRRRKSTAAQNDDP